MSHTYQIDTLQDLLRIPPERRGECLRQIEYGLLLHEMAFGEDAPAAAFTLQWTDDGVRDVALQQPDGTPVLELQLVDDPQAEEERITDALNARVPGGAQVKDWLPSADDRGEVPHDTARAVMRAALAAASRRGALADFQTRVVPWLLHTFGAQIAADRQERGDRLAEETLELLQSVGYDRERVLSLVAYVWGRPPGEPAQEVGGVMVTLAAFCHAHALDMHAAAEAELARVWTKVEAIRAKQAAKPTGSALPIAYAPSGAAGEDPT